MQTQQEQALVRLRDVIEETVGRKMKPPKDFDFLAGLIFDKLHENVSSTTLKRIWGYLSEPSTPRFSTLDILAQFVDYVAWKTCRSMEAPKNFLSILEEVLSSQMNRIRCSWSLR